MAPAHSDEFMVGAKTSDHEFVTMGRRHGRESKCPPGLMAVIDRAMIRYYDRLARTYDAERFGNSYGRFLDAQERATLARLLPMQGRSVLDLGCGTGRLTDFATHGCDASIESVKLASQRHLKKTFVGADA